LRRALYQSFSLTLAEKLLKVSPMQSMDVPSEHPFHLAAIVFHLRDAFVYHPMKQVV
jgi:hypothetical protein